ncbi:glycoside hydrolase family 2 TIM barrel-domain containing protein [Shouchella patagoniensis]|uniref:glycoside hydrolase family 2 TIM barrel-domain containing protein n=1 Tax=Shouchella patagoniensis TaxID=228576 RepID=UPI0009951D9B|nr:glycoside hydrolase family 2 TIM barrel-domain containing protein [Shouchella patagoniensis]
MNKKVRFNDGWEFAKSVLEKDDYSDLLFEAVDIPHDWQINNTLDLYENSIGWYRKRFVYKKRAEQVLLCFNGVYMDSTVYVNQNAVGEWKYGYSSFEHDVTDQLVDGENEIIVKVMFQSPNSRWYPGAGINRDVWLKTRGTNHIVTDGIYITTDKQENGWLVDIKTELNLNEDVKLIHRLLDQDDQEISLTAEMIYAGGSSVRMNHQTMFIKSPKRWDIESPNLYSLHTELIGVKPPEKMESIVQRIGFRTIKLDPKEGFFLNERKLKLNGTCEHHDLGALGAAFNRTAQKRRFNLLKEMGVNAIRTAHNMPAKEWMDLADEMGLLIVTEAFDMWERSKTTYDYGRFFNEWALADIKSWVKRDRNHPSLLMWSIGNEIYDTHASERGQEITKMLMNEVKKYDPNENGKVTIGSNYMPWENAQACAEIVGVVGYNYGDKYYHKHHQLHPDWIIYGSETAAIVQSRGIYHFPFEKPILADDDEQCSALGNSSTSWGAKSVEACLIAERDAPFSLGQFIWSGFDYIGEPTPYHTKNAYFGQLDTATFKKDSYYMYQAAWTDVQKRPMVHLFPFWDFNEGQLIDVRVCSNASQVEVLLNGQSQGLQLLDHKHGTKLIGHWKIPYQSGELKAIAYDDEGQIIATDVTRSFGDAQSIRLKADKASLVANGEDLIFVEISVEDQWGNLVENGTNRVTVHITGAGRLVGLDNGDSTDYDQYKGVSRRLFSGKLMAIVAATLEAGEIQCDVFSEGLTSAQIQFQAVRSQNAVVGISASTKNRERAIETGTMKETPLRKIALSSHSGQRFDATNNRKVVQVQLFPETTSYREIEWSVVNDVGIESTIAKVEARGQEAIVTAVGDGHFRLRCTSKNGTNKIKLISELEFSAQGLGMAYKDPYEFISAGLYDFSNGEVSNGNERGVATSRDGETQVGFSSIDFGRNGSDTITIPIFALSSDLYTLQIWEGIPGEAGSELLGDFTYQKESKWNVYQEETYRLSKKLRGVTSICFVVNQKIHIKGFLFQQKNRANEVNFVNECDHIYGDSFTKTDEAIEHIGNNVSIEFTNLDFTHAGATKLFINGYSPIDKNAIHIHIENEQCQSKQMVEFDKSDGYEERAFDLEKIRGLQNVTFVFLPGSHFHFKSFRFA